MRTIAALILASLLIAAGTAFAADDFTPEPGFKSLFNGKDLSGWKYGKESLEGKTASDDGRFAAKDGTIYIKGANQSGAGAKNSEIDTTASFGKDFVLRFDFKASKDCNSGLHLRDHVFKHQLQIRDYPRVGPYKTLKNYKEFDWNSIEVTVKGNKAIATCNGEVLEAALELPTDGPIGLQSETNVVEYRHIRIKEMP